MSGDSKPNLLNADLIPFHDCEPHDIWDYAPNYNSLNNVYIFEHLKKKHDPGLGQGKSLSGIVAPVSILTASRCFYAAYHPPEGPETGAGRNRRVAPVFAEPLPYR
jgi:hypothetical protein